MSTLNRSVLVQGAAPGFNLTLTSHVAAAASQPSIGASWYVFGAVTFTVCYYTRTQRI
jgi:hypothetical protein